MSTHNLCFKKHINTFWFWLQKANYLEPYTSLIDILENQSPDQDKISNNM